MSDWETDYYKMHAQRVAEAARLKEWREARKAFLALPAGDTGAREALNRLSDAEDKLYRGAE